MQASIGRWRALSAIATGSNHRSRDRPCQDALRVVAGGNDTPPVVAVADGHGHLLHFRSQRGAALAVEAACGVIADNHEELAQIDDPTEFVNEARRVLIPALMTRWRREVRADLESSPVEESELNRLGFAEGEWQRPDPSSNDSTLTYGTTLLFAAVIGPHLLMAQIGDGDIFAFSPDGATSTPVPGDPALDGSRTTSMCQANAADAFRLAVIDLRITTVGGVALATDGYGNSQVAEDWYQEVGDDLARYLRTRGIDWLDSHLQGWVDTCASTDGSGDDTTLVLLVPVEAPTSSAAAPATPAKIGPSTPAGGFTALALTDPERTLPYTPEHDDDPADAQHEDDAAGAEHATDSAMPDYGAGDAASDGDDSALSGERSNPLADPHNRRLLALAAGAALVVFLAGGLVSAMSGGRPPAKHVQAKPAPPPPAQTLPATNPVTHLPMEVTVPTGLGEVTDHLQEGNYLVVTADSRVWRLPVVQARGSSSKSTNPIPNLDTDLYPIGAQDVTVTSDGGQSTYIINVTTMGVCDLNSGPNGGQRCGGAPGQAAP